MCKSKFTLLQTNFPNVQIQIHFTANKILKCANPNVQTMCTILKVSNVQIQIPNVKIHIRNSSPVHKPML